MTPTIDKDSAVVLRVFAWCARHRAFLWAVLGVVLSMFTAGVAWTMRTARLADQVETLERRAAALEVQVKQVNTELAEGRTSVAVLRERLEGIGGQLSTLSADVRDVRDLLLQQFSEPRKKGEYIYVRRNPPRPAAP